MFRLTRGLCALRHHVQPCGGVIEQGYSTIVRGLAAASYREGHTGSIQATQLLTPCLETHSIQGSNVARCYGTSPKKSVDPVESEKFGAVAEEWWRADGPFSMLHMMNPIRCTFIRNSLCNHFRLDPSAAEPFEGLNILDVGCGGGLLCESLARMGATVTGVDATARNIRIAETHAAADPLVASRVTYHATTVEDLVARGKKFDAVMCLEVVEHVLGPEEFCAALGDVTKLGGALVMSTMNRTAVSYGVAILGAEYIAKIVPPGTHDWERFVTPEELTHMVECGGLELSQIAGITYNPLLNKWSLNDDLRCNYIAMYVKELQHESAGYSGLPSSGPGARTRVEPAPTM